MNHITPTDVPVQTESTASAVSWAPIIGGAFVSGAFAWIFILLGIGLGLSVISPWSGEGVSAMTIGLAAVIWMIATHAIASGLGGYLAGRLRTKWSNLDQNEVFFRDTAHGFLVWAVSMFITAALLGGVVATIVSGGAKLAATTATVGTIAATSGGGDNEATGLTDYFSDMMLRSDQPGETSPDAVRDELGRILTQALRTGTIPDVDRSHVASVIARQTGLSQAEAQARVDEVYAEAQRIAAEAKEAARTAADEARKATRTASLWVFVALLAGAFCASYAATIGGRQRDILTDDVVIARRPRS